MRNQWPEIPDSQDAQAGDWRCVSGTANGSGLGQVVSRGSGGMTSIASIASSSDVDPDLSHISHPPRIASKSINASTDQPSNGSRLGREDALTTLGETT